MTLKTITLSTATAPSRFPERPIHAATEKWWIAKVKPRQEKLLAQDFFENGIEYYLPLYIKNTPRTGSKSPRLFQIPLFAGYISFAQEKPHDIYTSGRVVSIIEVRHQKRFITEMNQIYCLLQGNAPLSPIIEEQQHSPPGTPVLITHGPFTGTRGIIHQNSTESEIILSVECLGNASLKIDPAWIKEDKSEESV